MNSSLNSIIRECELDLLLLRDFIEMNWNGFDKDWAEDQVNDAIVKIRKLIPREESEDE